MYRLFVEGKCLYSSEDIDQFIDAMDYIFVDCMGIGNIMVEINDDEVYVDIKEMKDYFKIRNELVIERSSVYESRELNKV